MPSPEGLDLSDTSSRPAWLARVGPEPCRVRRVAHPIGPVRAGEAKQLVTGQSDGGQVREEMEYSGEIA